MSTNPTPLSDTRFEAWYLRRIEDGTLGNSEGGSFGMDMIALAFRDAGDEARERVRVLEEFRAAVQGWATAILRLPVEPHGFVVARECLRLWRAVPSPTEEPPTPEASR
jgi:hypothetical protein